MNLLLVGQRGSGKTSAGRMLAFDVGAPFFDTDEEVERSLGKPLYRIFEEDGESAFREAEREAVLKIGSLDGHVVSAGGGTPVDEGNRKILRSAGRVVWLHAEPETLLCRRMEGDRPPMTNLPIREEIEFIATKRGPVYAETAHLRIDTDHLSLEEVVHELERIWLELPNHDLR